MRCVPLINYSMLFDAPLSNRELLRFPYERFGGLDYTGRPEHDKGVK